VDSEVEIRRVKDSDTSVLAEMYCRLNIETFDWMPKNTFSISDFEEDTQGEEILVAVVEDKILGFVSLLVSENLIHQLYVDTSAQGMGLGKTLLDAVVQLTEQRPLFLNCREKNERAINFYKKYGFKTESQMDNNSDSYLRLVLD